MRFDSRDSLQCTREHSEWALSHQANASGKPSVLVVDDETGPRDALKVMLRPFFTIHSADNAKSALRVLKDQHIDLITLDQKLPDRQGIDLLQDIKQDYADIGSLSSPATAV